MKQMWYTTESEGNFRGAFGRTGQPYSGAAPRGDFSAKVELGHDFYYRSAL